MAEMLLLFALCIAIQLVMFVPAFFFRTDKLTDISYGLSFIIIAWLALAGLSTYKLVLAWMITIWGSRLSLYLFKRILKTGKDSRFDGMREHAGKFLRFWLLQGLAVFVVMVPSLYALSSNRESVGSVAILGLVVWLAGFVIEAVADHQKSVFKRDPKNKGLWIASGLWRYSRHPNYFGEILCWVGVYIYAFESLSLFEALIGLVSPLFIAVLLIFVSGIPLLERQADARWGKLKAYKSYKAKTSVLVPFPPRNI